MDNNKDNSLKNELDSENQEWLTRLLSGEETAPATEAKPRDAELERILNENWSGDDTVTSTPEATVEVTDTIGDDFDFDALLAADALSEEPERTPIPVDIQITAEEPTPAEIPVVTEEPAPVETPAPAAPPAPEKKPIPVQKPVPAKFRDIEPETFAEEQEEDAEADAPTQKGRPKRQSGYGLFGIPHIVSTLIWLALILAIGVSLGRTLWVCCADVMAFGKESKVVTITITEDDDIDSIAKKLGDADLVRYPSLFKFFADVTGKSDNIGVGTFTLNAHLDYNAMINAMYDFGPEQQVVTLMFPEGYNCAQIFKLLEDNGVCSAAALEDYSMKGELQEYWFLEGVSRDSKYCLEGYLAPDTYKFYVGDSPRRVLEKFLDEFNERFTDLMKEDFEKIKQNYASRLQKKGYSSSYIEEHTLTIQDIVTLASIIQKETASDAECYDIASTFYNRLVANMQLGADATVYYAIGDYFWETKELTQKHLDFDSPYNTRKNRGIPPSPICNMGVHALYAALEPNDTGYYYFVFDTEKNAHRFAKTEAEHIKNLKELGY